VNHGDFREECVKFVQSIELGVVRLTPVVGDPNDDLAWATICWEADNGWTITVFFDGIYPKDWDYIDRIDAADGRHWESFSKPLFKDDKLEKTLNYYRPSAELVRSRYPVIAKSEVSQKVSLDDQTK